MTETTIGNNDLRSKIDKVLVAKRGNFKDCEIAYSLENIDMLSMLPEGVLVSHASLQNPVSNLDWEYLHFTDSSVFSPAAQLFNKNKELYGEGRYTNAIPGTTEYKQFWNQEKKRCRHGFEPIVNDKPCGVRITGEHYFYLNYCIIDKYVQLDTGEETKWLDFPNFVSMDYYWFLEVEKCENPIKYGLKASDKRGIILTKARRKGWSYKNAAGVVWKYTFFKRSRCIIASYGKEFGFATFGFCLNMLNFLVENTPFRHGRVVDREGEGYIESGEIKKVNGREVKTGYRSSIQVLTFTDKPAKAAGKSATRVLFEEGGTFANLKAAYRFTEPLFREGKNMIGIPIIFGTGGDMSGMTQDFSDMFYHPGNYGLKVYHNIYDQDKVGSCGLFVDEMWYRPGTTYINGMPYVLVDNNGNPNRWAAEADLNNERELSRKNKADYDILITQRCKTPKEAFLIPDGNIFPTADLYERVSKLRSEENYKILATAGTLVFSDDQTSINGVKFIPDVENLLKPLFHYPVKITEERAGCVVIYESPIRINGEVPNDMYVIGHDPYAINTDEGESLGATYVLLSNNYIKEGYNKIVATYIGRPTGGNSMGVYNTNLEKLSLYYGNAPIMFENSRGTVMEYFQKRKKIHLLMDEPGYVLTKVTGKKWSTSRIKGCSMEPPKMKQQMELYIYDWLLEERGKNMEGVTIRNLDLIPDIGLLDELISYNRDKNCDRVMAFGQVVIALEETFNKYEDDPKTNKEKDPLHFLRHNKKLFTRRIYKNETH